MLICCLLEAVTGKFVFCTLICVCFTAYDSGVTASVYIIAGL